MTNLKDINFGINQYCGPSVLSALTGESTDKCAAVISAVSGRKEIKAVQREHLIEAFKRLRFDMKKTDFSGSTLYGTLQRMHTYDGMYIVFVPNHVVAVEITGTEIFICDNHSKTPLDIRNSARLMQKVEEVYKVEAKNPPKFVKSEITIKKWDGRVEINRINIYENLEDNNSNLLGSIRYNNIEELEQIINKLACISYEEVLCPECNGKMISRKGKFGVFWGCKDYPRCVGTRDNMGRSKADRAKEKGEEHEDETNKFSFKKTR